MKSEKAEKPEIYNYVKDNKQVKIWFRENIQEHEATEDKEVSWTYDEYTLLLRDRAGLENYILNNFDALMQKAKEAEKEENNIKIQSKLEAIDIEYASDRSWREFVINNPDQFSPPAVARMQKAEDIAFELRKEMI